MIKIPDNLSYEEYKCFYSVITLTLFYTFFFVFSLVFFCVSLSVFKMISFHFFYLIRLSFSSAYLCLRLLLRKISIFSKPNLISDFSCCP